MSETGAAPGASIGLPAHGCGSLASWGKRIGALILDWGASMVVASAVFGPAVIRSGGWQMWMPMAVFFVESVLFTALAGGSFGQIVARVAVVRLDDLGPIGWWRAIVRTAMKCLVIPALVIGAERRGLDDLVLGTVVVNRK
ncbi:RDD family protein [Cutibacterium sp.]|uniref:RDD family protein n=1 Tax=Cutibacterium sp. TaxID=1912221 RepID=UPI0026DD41DF|nr:RDD family protein [Cutibacterium sp.]MDO4411567.1 RDD family protein [Cutibacterium sp.]